MQYTGALFHYRNLNGLIELLKDLNIVRLRHIVTNEGSMTQAYMIILCAFLPVELYN